jgi:hypothetical protein
MGKSKLTVDLPDELKTEFKIYCAVNQVSMVDVIEQLIRGYLSNHPKIKGAM